jgi:argininosuccinate lyase
MIAHCRRAAWLLATAATRDLDRPMREGGRHAPIPDEPAAMTASNSSPAPTSGGWSGRFSEPVSELVKRYTASVGFDHRLAEFDIRGSLAHARMLGACGILSATDVADIERGMASILEEVQAGRFEWKIELEDVHLNIERRLTELVGDAGKRLHTGRSRNDQVATDVRLWLRAAIDEIDAGLGGLQAALLGLADAHVETAMPGFTHLQVAQPVSFAHHLLAYFEMLARDRERFADCRRRVNRLPLGAAALAGTSYPIDRARVARELGFEDICRNSLDAVSDRDFAIEFTAAAALVMTHLSRLSEELILWMSPRFGFIDLADRFCTGSSIMPQKKNPDVPELVRGKVGRVNGHLIALLTLMKGQPLAYNKDNQEDKEPLFDTVDTLLMTLAIYADMVGGIRVRPDAMRAALAQGYATATDLADYLVRRGVPFRDAHEIVARAVRYAERAGCDLPDLPLEQLRAFSPAIAEDVHAVLTVEGSLASRAHPGGTAPSAVREALAQARARLQA